MNDLIKVSSGGSIGGREVQTVNLRELHKFLLCATDFTHWIGRRIEEYGFTQHVDYVTSFLSVADKGSGRTEYHGSLDMAKELAMVERNAKGRQARRYFIECERRALAAVPTLDLTNAASLRTALLSFTEKVIALEATIEKQAPAVEFAQTIRDMDETIDMARMARVLKWGRNTLFAAMVADRILMENRLPYQKYMDRGYFKVIEGSFEHRSGKVEPTFSTRVTGKGQVYLQRKYAPATVDA